MRRTSETGVAPHGVSLNIAGRAALEAGILRRLEHENNATESGKVVKATREKVGEWTGADGRTITKARRGGRIHRSTLLTAFTMLDIPWSDDYLSDDRQEQDDDAYSVHPTAAAWAGPCPPTPSLICGRHADIETIHNRLVPGPAQAAPDSARRCVCVWGLPGVGKTTLAAALCHDRSLRAAFPDGLLWAALGENVDVERVLGEWGAQLGNDQIAKAESEQRARNLLAGHVADRRLLFVLDDVWACEHAAPLLVGGNYSGAVIFTGEPGIAHELAPRAADVYHLQELDAESSLSVLEKLAPTVVKQHRQECIALCEALGRLPFALDKAGRQLNREAKAGLDVGGLLRALRKNPDDLVAALLRRATNRMEPPLQELFALLAPFAPKPSTIPLDALQFVWQVDSPAPVVRALVEHGLLETAGDGLYQIHALLARNAAGMLE